MNTYSTRIISTLCFVLLLLGANAQNATLIPYDSPWKIRNTNSAPKTDWNTASFDDSNWDVVESTEMGNGQVYQMVEGKRPINEDEEEALEELLFKPSYGAGRFNKIAATYFRRTIDLADAKQYSKYIVNYRKDEGIVLYVNGIEAFRNNMPAGTVSYNTLASEESNTNRYATYKASISADLFVNGTNLVAVEIHKNNLKNKYNNFNLELIGLANNAAPTLTRGPFLQKQTQNTIIVHWQTQTPSDAKVMYGTDAKNLNQYVINTDATATDHILRLDELKPDTKYYYNIGTTTDIIQGDSLNFFYSAPIAGSTQKLNFWAIGDYGVNTGNTNELKMRDAFYKYSKNMRIDGWITMGDNAYLSGLNTEFQSWVFDVFGAKQFKNTPYWPSPGNHDYNNNPVDQTTHNVPYFANFDLPANGECGGVASGNEHFYSYDRGNVHFLALDAYGLENNKLMADTTGPQCEWIKKDLEANKLPWVIAYWHHPPYTKGSHNGDTESDLGDIRSIFLPFLEKYNVDVVLCGHSHSYERSYLIKGFKGNSETFDPAKHAVSASSGRYDGTPNSAPYIKKLTNKGTGTVYLVGGSSGQLGGKSAGYPHHAMAFSNESIPGSCILTFEDTRLDLKWLGGDDSIHDKFTMFKGVNRHNYVEIVKGDSVTLTASWPGDYIWSNGATTRSITVSPAEAQDYIVKDVLGYLADTNSVSLKIANAINDKTANVQVSIYPNPSNGNGTQLTINQCIDKQVNVQVTNLLGQQILPVKTIKLSNGMATEWLPLTVKGLYLVHLQGINTNTTVQVEVQ